MLIRFMNSASRSFCCFSADEGTGGSASAGSGDVTTAGIGLSGATDETADHESQGAAGVSDDATRAGRDNEANKFRRLFEAEQKKTKALEQAEETRKLAEMSEVEKEKARADKAEASARELLRKNVAIELGLSSDAAEFLTAFDEDGLRAQAQKLKGIVPAAQVQAGTVTQPAANQKLTMDQQIAAAQKAGSHTEAVRLKRAQAGLP